MATPARVVVVPKDPGPLEIHDLSLPDPGPHHVVVKQYASGICHSQLHQMHRPRQSPVVLGHESTGIVLKVGSEVRDLAEGDTVMLTWVPKDAVNANHITEAVTLDLGKAGTAVSQNVFTWATHTIADEDYVVKVPADTTRDVTSIIGCAVMTGAGAVEYTAAVSKGESVAVIGVGGVGISAIVAARKIGADPIIAVDLSNDKLEFARKFGATHTINASDKDPIAAIHELTTRKNAWSRRPVTGADFVFDCIGIKKTMEQIVPAARSGHFGVERGGTAVLVGVPTTSVELNPGDILMNEKRFIGSIGGSCSPGRDFPKYLDWYASGDLDLDSLVTERFGIDQINEATTRLEQGEIFGRAILEFED
jgi:Zn-dependent alcohol dehydrogenase